MNSHLKSLNILDMRAQIILKHTLTLWECAARHWLKPTMYPHTWSCVLLILPTGALPIDRVG